MNRTQPFALIALFIGAFTVIPNPAIAAEEGHDHKQADHAQSEAQTRVGDPYPLPTDAVTDQPLAEVEKPVALLHEGRELRFADAESVETFKAEPQKYLDKVDVKIIENQMPYYPMTTCPVSGDKLGGDMGEPVDYVYGNRLILFCCKGCKGDFLKDPSAMLEKLDAAVIAQQKEAYPLETCPVSGQKLGSMGEPVDVVLANRLVRLCCAGCKGKLTANPAKVLAEVDAAWEANDAKPAPRSAAEPAPTQDVDRGHDQHKGRHGDGGMKKQEGHGDHAGHGQGSHNHDH